MKYDIRFWEKEYREYIHGGGKRPGQHPDPTHKWNTNPELFDEYDLEEDRKNPNYLSSKLSESN